MDLTTIEEDILTLLTSKPLTGHHIKDGLHLIYEVKEDFLNGS